MRTTLGYKNRALTSSIIISFKAKTVALGGEYSCLMNQNVSITILPILISKIARLQFYIGVKNVSVSLLNTAAWGWSRKSLFYKQSCKANPAY